MNTIRIYTDGGCSPNPGKGGWAIVVSENEHFRGQKKRTTNNEMELMAFRNAILYKRKYYPEKDLIIVSDSKYCVDGFNKWMHGWAKKKWKKKGGIKNLELWKEVFKYSKNLNIKSEWVKGHSGNKFNELADSLTEYIN